MLTTHSLDKRPDNILSLLVLGNPHRIREQIQSPHDNSLLTLAIMIRPRQACGVTVVSPCRSRHSVGVVRSIRSKITIIITININQHVCQRRLLSLVARLQRASTFFPRRFLHHPHLLCLCRVSQPQIANRRLTCSSVNEDGTLRVCSRL